MSNVIGSQCELYIIHSRVRLTVVADLFCNHFMYVTFNVSIKTLASINMVHVTILTTKATIVALRACGFGKHCVISPNLHIGFERLVPFPIEARLPSDIMREHGSQTRGLKW